MNLAFYMDVHIPRAVTDGLRLRGIDVVTAQEDGSATFDDAQLVSRVTVLERVLVSQDTDMLREGAMLLRAGRQFSGIIYASQLRVTLGEMIGDLELLAKATTPAEWVGRIEYLPLR